MFASIAKLSLLTLALPVTAFASSHRQLLNRHHGDIAKRNNNTLERRTSNSRWSFYNVETGNAGSCGQFHVNSDFTVAMNDEMMNSGFCFKNIRMTYNGKSTIASVTDTCPGCPYGGLDLTEGLFKFFAPASVGIIYGDWEFVDGSGGGSSPATTKKTTSSVWHPPTTSIWQPPKTTSTKEKPTPTTTWTPPPTTKKTSTSTSSKPSTTSTKHSTTSTSSTSSTTSTTSINYSTGPASGLAVPTGTIESETGAPQNVASMYQAFIQVGGLIAGAANI
ncbi:hypothetical protein BDN70DRAFT_882603 [Pholiota conissans]|uniref:Uncharacterized protein n=1 Tax=Pholiota conissans TaxID=109636 RepID=A0A9P6CQW6_9AGAR|nr:hypothetical protein BDN70DRAFT_882603 [Pholiota conissans]